MKPGLSRASQDESDEPDGEGDGESTFFLGRYRVVDEIGRGGMATVHLARVEGPGGFHKWVAIKRIHPGLVESDQLVDMFLDEARMAAGISHPNVAQVFDIGRDKTTYWIAMEYLHGEPLRELTRISEERPAAITPPEIAACIIADAAEGLHAAHELRGKSGQLLGLVHRDVSPHNLFITYEGHTKVVDFGIAKAAGRLASTHAGELKGKMAYMAPEQLRGQELDRRADIFALGIVLWELTTNRRLFRMESDIDTLEKVQACNVPRPTTIVAGYPQELEDIVMMALARDRNDRYETARAFSRALRAYSQRLALVGSEEVSEFMKRWFAARLRRRDDHLAWAGEVTGTIPRAGRPELHSDSEVSTLDNEDETEDRKQPSLPPPRIGPTSLAEQAKNLSLADEDDEAATLVASKSADYLAQFGIGPGARKPPAVPAPPSGPRPAAGVSAAMQAAQAGPPQAASLRSEPPTVVNRGNHGTMPLLAIPPDRGLPLHLIPNAAPVDQRGSWLPEQGAKHTAQMQQSASSSPPPAMPPFSPLSPVDAALNQRARENRQRLTIIVTILATACAVALSFLIVRLLRGH